MKNLLSTLISLLIFGVSCGDNQSSQEANPDGMAKFVKESDFRSAHETPATIAFEQTGTMVTFATADGKTGNAYQVKPADAGRHFLIVIHEWWGLNDYVKLESQKLADSLGNVTVLALDLYDGKVAADQKQASEYVGSVTKDRAENIIRGAMNYAGEDANFATLGWCFGGGWSLKTAILAGDRANACVIYYGMPVETAAELAPLKAEVLGIFAAREKWISPEVVHKFEALAKATGKKLTVHSFDADHAFANPSSPRYQETAAIQANQLALAFLRSHLK